MKVKVMIHKSLESYHVWTKPSWIVTLTLLSALRGLCAGLSNLQLPR